MYARPTAPLSVGGVVDEAIRLYRSSLPYCWGIALGYGVVSAIGQIVIVLNVSRQFSGRQTTSALMTQLVARDMAAGVALVSLLVALASLIFYGAILARQSAFVKGDEKYTALRALATGLKRLPAVIFGSIVFAVIIAIGFCVPLVPAVSIWGRVALWFIPLLVIPGIYLWGRLALWFAPLFAEEASAMSALETSWRLTRGNWWRSSIILTVAVIMLLVLYMAVTALAGAIAVLGPKGFLAQQITIRMVAAVVSIFLVPLMPALWLAMYYDFKLRREGADLEARAGALNRAA